LKRRISPWLLASSGVALITVAMVINWLGSERQGQDFGYIYSAAVAIATGAPLYDTEWQRIVFPTWGLPPPPLGIFYPPATGFTALPFAALPYTVAKATWFFLLNLLVILGVRGIVKLLRPDSTPGVWLLAAGAVLVSSCMRWGMAHLQGAPLVFALLAFLVVGLHTQRPAVVLFVAAYATTFKFTIAFPFLGLLFLHKRYGALIGAVAVAAILNFVGFLRVGGSAALGAYRTGLGRLESFGAVNSPDPWDPQSSPRLDWHYLFNGLSGHLQASRVLAYILFAVVCLWLVRRSRYIQPPVSIDQPPISIDVTVAFLVPLVCLSVLCIYHHHYDISPLWVPLIILFARLGEYRPGQNRWALSLMAPLIVMMAFLPIALGWQTAVRVIGPAGWGVFNMLLAAATTLMLVGSLLIVRQVVPERESASVSGEVVGS
jgi:Glycosyltransferase family 87